LDDKFIRLPRIRIESFFQAWFMIKEAGFEINRYCRVDAMGSFFLLILPFRWYDDTIIAIPIPAEVVYELTKRENISA
jgi:hypothetical protein